MKTRIGFGFDVHKLVEGRELWLGGIRIEHTLGLLGHSDADVLIHALCDALLGAANMRDIGFHFPDTANEYKNIDFTKKDRGAHSRKRIFDRKCRYNGLRRTP